MYYKIITPKSFFRDICPYGIDVLHIPTGTEVISPFDTPDDESEQPEDRIDLGPAYIHFADGAFNTMMWYTWFFQKRHVQNNQIYTIQPSGLSIVQGICQDYAKLPQYGSNSIIILEKQNINNMYDMALAEYHDNKHEIAETYSHLKMQPIIKAWQKHTAKCEFKTR